MIFEVVSQTIMITSLVLVMMLLIEYFNVISRGDLGKNLAKSKWKQIFVSALLGLVPGCIGGFAVVGMFTHGFINFGALTAAMITSTGDESFVMFSMFPKMALLLNVALFIIAIVAGFVINYFMKSKTMPINKAHMVIHTHEFEQPQHSWKQIVENFKNISFQRAVLLFGVLMFLFGVFTGQFEHGGHEISHSTETTHHSILSFENILFVALTMVVLYLLCIVDEHFLNEHLWEHIIKKHFLRIFLWTFGALFTIELLIHFVDFNQWMNNNHLFVLFVALLIGFIPQSGPNLIVVSLYFSGTLPLSILMANSIIQDGHSSLPLLAESKKYFLLLKAINFAIGLAIGILGYYFMF